MERQMQTPSQTVGPYFAYGLVPQQYFYDFDSWVNGEMVSRVDHPDGITIIGKVFDGVGEVIPDAMIELWLDDGEQQLFGRFGTGTDPENRFVFYSPKPKANGKQAPFITVIVFMRGQLLHSFTRMYFSDEAKRNDKDPVLNLVPAERRHTLIAQKKVGFYEFNIHMQGINETVFFDM